jgi:hypothetical protein
LSFLLLDPIIVTRPGAWPPQPPSNQRHNHHNQLIAKHKLGGWVMHQPHMNMSPDKICCVTQFLSKHQRDDETEKREILQMLHKWLEKVVLAKHTDLLHLQTVKVEHLQILQPGWGGVSKCGMPHHKLSVDNLCAARCHN